ncbi:MAG TPA: hypothetical protein VGI58_21005 [Streptosporangiaceae bacterium]|jgi:hypothetical protein
MVDSAETARRMYSLFEPVHVISYFAEPATGAWGKAGLRGYWRGYFAGRAAPIGAVGAAPVTAAFFSFAPHMVGRALPGIWDLITPARALEVRLAGAVAALRDLLSLDDQAETPEPVRAAADLLTRVIEDIDGAGRPLGGPNAALPVPDEPLARLWHAATVLREHRGDGHIAALVASGLDGPEALALRAGLYLAQEGDRSRESDGMWKREWLQPVRGWTDEQWDAAAARLADRGLLTAAGAATPAGVTLHAELERVTDAAAARPWATLSATQTGELAGLLPPIAAACAAVLPFASPAAASETSAGAHA